MWHSDEREWSSDVAMQLVVHSIFCFTLQSTYYVWFIFTLWMFYTFVCIKRLVVHVVPWLVKRKTYEYFLTIEKNFVVAWQQNHWGSIKAVDFRCRKCEHSLVSNEPQWRYLIFLQGNWWCGNFLCAHIISSTQKVYLNVNWSHQVCHISCVLNFSIKTFGCVRSVMYLRLWLFIISMENAMRYGVCLKCRKNPCEKSH